jgi:hypothetical protein
MKLRMCNPAGVLATFLLATAVGPAYAQATPPDAPSTAPLLSAPAAPMSAKEFAAPPMSDSFAELDRDKDGAVTRSEAERNVQVAMAFKRLDESRDGRLDLAEYAQLRAPPNRK